MVHINSKVIRKSIIGFHYAFNSFQIIYSKSSNVHNTESCYNRNSQNARQTEEDYWYTSTPYIYG